MEKVDKQQPTLRQQLLVVEQRLAETLQVHAAYSTINRSANKQANPTLNVIVNQRSGFWHATAISFQTHLFTGIYALVERGPKVVTLETIAQRLKKDGKPELQMEAADALDAVRKRYEKFRHTLFGHNGKDREALADRFDEYGFTWDMVENDLATLEHTFKVLWLPADDRPVPSHDEVKQMRFPYRPTVENTAEDTLKLLNDLEARSRT